MREVRKGRWGTAKDGEAAHEIEKGNTSSNRLRCYHLGRAESTEIDIREGTAEKRNERGMGLDAERMKGDKEREMKVEREDGERVRKR